jgi:hypothetical protein
MIIEVFVDYKQHEKLPAMVQVFINANTGNKVNQTDLQDLTLDNVFTDSCGRKVMVFKTND